MDDFTYQNGVKIHFGKGIVRDLGHEVGSYSDRALIVFGGKSSRLNGSYNDVISSLTEHHIFHWELEGIKPNPVISKVREGIEICRKNSIGAIIAIGGGSAIDTAKIIAAGVNYGRDPWDFFAKKDSIDSALPLFTVLTIAAAGSEFNKWAVITNDTTGEKKDCGSDFLLPKVTFEDPVYSFSVGPKQTAAGTADITSHIMENYFGNPKGSYVQDRLAEALLKTCIHYGPLAIKNPTDYEARSNLMFASSLPESGLISSGHAYDFVVHPLEHPLSGMYDITHGEGLAILTPVYYEYVLNKNTVQKFIQFATGVFNISPEEKSDLELAKAGIKALKDFYKSMGLPSSLREIGVKNDKFALLAEQALDGKSTLGSFCPLSKTDIINIYKSAY